MVSASFSHTRRHIVRAACVMGLVCLAALASCGYDYETGGGKPAGAVDSSASSDVLVAPEMVDASDAKEPVLDAQGWWAKDSYVHYGVKVSNPNAGYVAHNVQVHVVLRDEAGAVASEATGTIAQIGPGQTTGFTGTAGDGWAPTSVDIELVEGSAQYSSAEGFAEPFAIEGLNEQDKGEFRYELSGEVVNNTETYVSTVDLHTLLIDGSGAIVAGYPAEAYKIKPGQTKGFIHTINSAPDHATVEVYALPRY